MKDIYLSVVIPAYNEEKNLKRGVLASVNDFLVKQKYSWEVLIVNDGSRDKTAEIVSDFVRNHQGFILMNEPHRGKGGTVIAGMLASNGKLIVFTDMDQSTPIDQLTKFTPFFAEGYDLVIGSRIGRKGATIVRRIMAKGWEFLRNLILNLPFKDTQCGFKALTKKAANDIAGRMMVFNEAKRIKGEAVTAGFDLELLFIARKLGLKIKEVPVEWYEWGERKEVNPIKDSWQGFIDLVKVKINALSGKYDIN